VRPASITIASPSLHLSRRAAAVYERFIESGDSSVDFSGIIRYLRGD